MTARRGEMLCRRRSHLGSALNRYGTCISRGSLSGTGGRLFGRARRLLLTGHDLVPLNNFCHHRNLFVHALYQAIGQRIRWQNLDRDLSVIIKAHPELAGRQLR